MANSVDLQQLLYLCQKASSPSDVKIPSSATIASIIDTLYLKYQSKVKQYLKSQDSISFTHDMWSSRKGDDYFAIIAHFINENWEMESITIAFEHPSQSHTGEHMADIFVGVMDNYGILDRIGTITCDNASNNMSMGKRLQELGETTHPKLSKFQKEKCIVPCLNHVLDLSLQLLLRQGLKSQAKDENGIHNLMQSGNADLETDMNSVLQNPLNKLRQGIIKIRYVQFLIIFIFIIWRFLLILQFQLGLLPNIKKYSKLKYMIAITNTNKKSLFMTLAIVGARLMT